MSRTDGGADAPRAPRSLTLRFSERKVPVRFIEAIDVADQVHRALHGWTISPGDETSAPVTVRGLIDGYQVESVWLDQPISGLTSVAAACCVIVDVLESLLDADPSLLCLHCAAAEIAGRLVIMTGPSHAGKSTLATRLSSEDLALFCDDMLPLDADGQGVAVGIGPRLRMPLPPRASPALLGHVARYLGPADGRYGFVNAPSVARHGRRAPIGAVILLDRRTEGPAVFRSAEPEEALGFLISQNITADREPEEVLDRLRRLVAEAPCARLEYSDLEDATDLLMRTFSTWPPRRFAPLPGRAPSPRPAAEHEDLVLPETVAPLVRRRDVTVRQVGEDLFLSQAEERRILQLNPVGRAIWTLLEEPTTPLEITEALSVVFPDAEIGTIESDVLRLLASMFAYGLVRVSER